MNNKIKNILIGLVVAIPAMTMLSCEKDFSDQDNDLIAGKWKDTAVLNNDTLSEAEYMAYVEYAPYSHLESKRVLRYVWFIIDTTLDDPIVKFEKQGRYTLSGDTLTVKDSLNKKHIYMIQYLRNDSLCYKEGKKTYTYVRSKD